MGATDYKYKYNKTKHFIYKQGRINLRHHKMTPEEWESWNSSMSPSRAAYFAGLFDGDGSFRAYKKGKDYLQAYIKLQDVEPLESLHEIYGTTIFGIRMSNPKHKTLYKLALNGSAANHFMQCVCPWLNEKRNLVTNLLNKHLPNYHPYKVPFPRKNDKFIASLTPLMCYVAGFFDAEGSATISLGKKGWLAPRVTFSNTNLRPLKKLKKFLENWPFIFKPTISTHKPRGTRKDGSPHKGEYKLLIPASQHLLFMKMFSPIMHLERKKRVTDRFELLRTVDDHLNTRKRLKRKYGSKR